MNPIIYYPILKWKSGERGALQHLKIGSERFIPVLELCEESTPVEFITELSNCYESPVYIDTSRWDDVDRTGLSAYISYAVEHDKAVWPVLYPEDILSNDTPSLPASPRLAVKLPIPEDFDGIHNSEIVDAIMSKFQECTVDLFLDAGVVLKRENANQAYSSYVDTITDLESKVEFFNSITICLTSFPEQLDVEAGSDAQYKRYDIKIFEYLHNKYRDNKISNLLAYSDYGVTKFTDTEIDFSKRKYAILPKVKYTTPASYICLKGKKARKSGEADRTFFDIAKDIIKSDYFAGQYFSYGDDAIYKKATGVDEKPGNNKQWVEYCANHHMAVVISQLSSLSET